jgi:hypothetical protein
MKKALVILGVASALALTGCGDPNYNDRDDQVPPPADQQPLPGEPGDDGLNDDMQP